MEQENDCIIIKKHTGKQFVVDHLPEEVYANLMEDWWMKNKPYAMKFLEMLKMNNDITWCMSPSCETKCERHITNCKLPAGSLVSIADFSRVCREYIRNVVDEVERREKGDSNTDNADVASRL